MDEFKKLVWTAVMIWYVLPVVSAVIWFTAYSHRHGVPPVLGLFEFDGFVWLMRDAGHQLHLPWRFGGPYTRWFSIFLVVLFLILQLLFVLQRPASDKQPRPRLFLRIPEATILWMFILMMISIALDVTGQWSALSTPNSSVIFWSRYIDRMNGSLVALILTSSFVLSWCCALGFAGNLEVQECRIRVALLTVGVGVLSFAVLWLGDMFHLLRYENSVYTAKFLAGLLVFYGGMPLILEWRLWIRHQLKRIRTLCPSCGYDLRGSIAANATHCPECGAVIPADVVAVPLQ